MNVWLSTLRRNSDPYHYINGEATVCGRHIGPSTAPPKHGYVLSLGEALETYGCVLCVTCDRERDGR